MKNANGYKLADGLARFRAQRERSLDRVIAEFTSDPKRLAREVLYLRQAIGSIGEAAHWMQIRAPRRFVDGRVAKYFEAHVEKLIERKVQERTREVYKEMREFATAVRKSIEAMADAINKHADLIRDLAKRDETDTRSSDNPRPLRIVN
jgi:hypothetical protein